jgi:hypothetical protein
MQILPYRRPSSGSPEFPVEQTKDIDRASDSKEKFHASDAQMLKITGVIWAKTRLVGIRTMILTRDSKTLLLYASVRCDE